MCLVDRISDFFCSSQNLVVDVACAVCHCRAKAVHGYARGQVVRLQRRDGHTSRQSIDTHKLLQVSIATHTHTMIYRVTTHLENLEKSGNSTVIREKSRKMDCQGKVRGSEIRCVFSRSKYSRTRFSAGALPRSPGPHWVSLRRSPRPSSRSTRGSGGATPHPLPPAATTPTVE